MKERLGKLMILTVGVLWIAAAWGCQSNPAQSAETKDNDPDVTEQYFKLNQLLEQDSMNPDLWALRAQLLYEKGSYDQAIEDIQRAIALDGQRLEYQHLLADCYLDYYRSREALDVLEQAFEAHPDSLYTGLKLSEFQLILKQYEASLRTLSAILNRDPNHPEAYFMMGLNYKELRDTGRAINSFQKAVNLNAEMVDGWIELGSLFRAKGIAMADQCFENAIRVDSTNPYGWFAKAYHLQVLGDTLEAIGLYAKTIMQDYRFMDAYYNSGVLWYLLDSLDKAYEQFDRIEALDKLDVRAYHYKGLIYRKRGEPEIAQEYFEQVRRIDPEYSLDIR